MAHERRTDSGLAAGDAAGDTAGARPRSPVEASRLKRILALSRRVAAQRDLRDTAAVAADAVMELTGAQRAYCLFHDARSGMLWAEPAAGLDEDARESHEHEDTAGLAGFAARTGQPVHVSRAGADPRYRAQIDDPRGSGDEHLVARPVLGPDAEAHAVLIAVRDGHRPDFSPAQREALALLAQCWGPLLYQRSLELEAEALLAEARRANAGDARLFRAQALEASVMRGKHGDVIRVSPAWVRRVFWLLVAVLVCGAAYSLLGKIEQYSSGPALIRSVGRTGVTATVAGTLASVAVVPGQQVEAGTVLARLHDDAEIAELQRIEAEWQARLRDYLFEPANASARQALASLRAERDRARARIQERAVRAPHAGVVGDVRVRPGQYLAPGDLVLTLERGSTDAYVIALLPGADRPQIRPGMPLRLALRGYRDANQMLTVDTVAEEVIGPTEARRTLGSGVADSIEIPGSVVLVTARLRSSSFEVDGKTYRYHDGMPGVAEVRIRSERILISLIPGLDT